ncbi:MAG TPA: hypothetical protein VFN42_11895, partial [Acetobacteraceae bacterium]|nr:hypothetical protein [Acetobacteraceae bacterium]
MKLRIGLYVVASWLIAAHFLRMDALALAALCLAAPLLFLLHRWWTLPLLQGLAYAAGAVWIVTAWQIVAMRRAFGLPWERSALILLAVAAISLLAGWLVRGVAAARGGRLV